MNILFCVNSMKSTAPICCYKKYYGSRFLLTLFTKLILLSAILVILYKLNILLFKSEREFRINFKNQRLSFWMRRPIVEPCPTPTKLLIMIMSRRDGLNNRNGIRRTWLTEKRPGMSVRFIVGDSQASDDLPATEEQKTLAKEQTEFGDIIFLRGIEDNYASLHLKWYAALLWQQTFCAGTEFVLKTDDDTIVHLPRLDHWMRTKFSQAKTEKDSGAAMFGWIIDGVKPIREKGHKWFVAKEDYPGEWYPAYLQGATYLASKESISAILEHTGEVHGFNMDDVLFTGILANRANVTRIDSKVHFRVGNQLDKEEKCTEGVPHLTAFYGAGTEEQFREVYSRMNSVTCPN